MKRVFGLFEAVFDVIYLSMALILGIELLITGISNNLRILAGIMALVLALGDSFHLLPRIGVIFTGREEDLRVALGRGKQITSVTMTIFYLFMWEIGKLKSSSDTGEIWTYIVYILAIIRIFICILPQNRWKDRYPPLRWAILRNMPFFMLGGIVSALFFIYKNQMFGLRWIWLAIVLSFTFYFPVVLWSNKNPKIGMLMLPKTCAYLWMLVMCLSL